MRTVLSGIFFIAVIGLFNPAQGQLRTEGANKTQTALYDSGARAFLLNTLFSPEHFKMSHSVEMSVGSGGGQTNSLAMYTNTLAWNFGQKLAARADISLAYSPFSSGSFNANGPGSMTGRNGNVFLRNAEVMYQPSENVRLHIAFQQSPYGYYGSPYGYYGRGSSPFGYPYRSRF
ncbi:MAG: hypothetical protein KDD65_18430 [Bacteroidetes bacterium]|nr:hypothetical protein [Bacteroidota bacterium]